MDEIRILKVSNEYDGFRLDKFISENDESISRSRAQTIIDEGKAQKNGKKLLKSYKVITGDIIELEVRPPKELKVLPEDIPLDIVYEDLDLLVVNKAQGMVVHPANGNWDKTLVNALMFHCKGSLSGINGVIRPGIVHRIDKNTSGLLIVAKNDFSHKLLAEQIKAHTFSREYEAVVSGLFKEHKGTVNAPIGRHPIDRKKMAVTYKNSKEAITHYTVIKEYSKFSHIRLKLQTGRTHQIRVHMAYINHPVAGDTVYGDCKNTYGLLGQCLHAKHIGFVHPRTGKTMQFESELPKYFKDFLVKIKT